MMMNFAVKLNLAQIVRLVDISTEYSSASWVDEL